MWQCMNAVANKVFERFISVMLETQPKNEIREKHLESHAQFLLVTFNHSQKQIRKVADQFLAKLMCNFPQLFWSRSVLWCMLDILQELTTCLQTNPNEQTAVLKVASVPYAIQLTDTLETRETVVFEFKKYCKSILEQGVKWSPATIRSDIHEYVKKIPLHQSHSHSGLTLAMECILQNPVTATSPTNSLNDDSLMKSRSKSLDADESTFLILLNLRTVYSNQISGMLLSYDSYENLVLRLTEDLQLFVDRKSESDLQNAIWKITALLISSDQFQRKLLHSIVWTATQLFTVI